MSDEKIGNSINVIKYYLDVATKNGSYSLEDVNKILVEFTAICKHFNDSVKRNDVLQSKPTENTK